MAKRPRKEIRFRLRQETGWLSNEQTYFHVAHAHSRHETEFLLAVAKVPGPSFDFYVSMKGYESFSALVPFTGKIPEDGWVLFSMIFEHTNVQIRINHVLVVDRPAQASVDDLIEIYIDKLVSNDAQTEVLRGAKQILSFFSALSFADDSTAFEAALKFEADKDRFELESIAYGSVMMVIRGATKPLLLGKEFLLNALAICFGNLATIVDAHVDAKVAQTDLLQTQALAARYELRRKVEADIAAKYSNLAPEDIDEQVRQYLDGPLDRMRDAVSKEGATVKVVDLPQLLVQSVGDHGGSRDDSTATKDAKRAKGKRKKHK